jgi:hypothetical protein
MSVNLTMAVPMYVADVLSLNSYSRRKTGKAIAFSN